MGVLGEVMERITSNTRELQRKREKMMRRRRKDKVRQLASWCLFNLFILFFLLSPHTLSLSLPLFVLLNF